MNSHRSEEGREPLEPERFQEFADWQPAPPTEPEDDVLDLTTMARPYVRTGGRAGTEYDLQVETMLGTTQLGQASQALAQLTTDLRMMCRLCQDPRSVAEIAVYLQAPLGVARVLIGDALRAGQLTILTSEHTVNGRPSIELMRRVFEGLRRLE
jgi:DNA-directed RNA polymerase specialized sigma24 family protein